MRIIGWLCFKNNISLKENYVKFDVVTLYGYLVDIKVMGILRAFIVYVILAVVKGPVSISNRSLRVELILIMEYIINL